VIEPPVRKVDIYERASEEVVPKPAHSEIVFPSQIGASLCRQPETTEIESILLQDPAAGRVRR